MCPGVAPTMGGGAMLDQAWDSQQALLVKLGWGGGGGDVFSGGVVRFDILRCRERQFLSDQAMPRAGVYGPC